MIKIILKLEKNTVKMKKLIKNKNDKRLRNSKMKKTHKKIIKT